MRQRRGSPRRTPAPRRAPNLSGAHQRRRRSRRHRLTTEVHHTPNLNRRRRTTAKRHILRRGDHQPLQERSPHSLTISLRPLDRRNSGPDRRPRCSSPNDPTVSSSLIPEPLPLTRRRWAWSTPSTPDADSAAVARAPPPCAALQSSRSAVKPATNRKATADSTRRSVGRTPPRSSPSNSPNETTAPSATSSPSLPRGEALIPSIRPAPTRIKHSSPGSQPTQTTASYPIGAGVRRSATTDPLDADNTRLSRRRRARRTAVLAHWRWSGSSSGRLRVPHGPGVGVDEAACSHTRSAGPSGRAGHHHAGLVGDHHQLGPVAGVELHPP
jgi:hypothetical protein